MLAKSAMHRRSRLSGLKNILDWLLAQLTFAFFALIRALGPKRGSDLGAFIMRSVGPLLPENRTARTNLRNALPALTDLERRRILRESWDNLGRTFAEYPNLDKLWDFDPGAQSAGRVEVVGVDRFLRLLHDGRPAIIFTGHLANWELLPIAASKHGLAVSAVYRTPNNPYVARTILKFRTQSMGRLIASSQFAALSMAAVLERGENLGLLVDQHFSRGIPVPFFGQPAMTNTTAAKLAERYNCPIYGARVVRLPDFRFRVELTPEIEPVRDPGGELEIAGTTARITAIVEGWVREHPGQWLWQHRRWRGGMRSR